MHYPEEQKLIHGGIGMENNNCENCGFRAKYDNERIKLADRYNLTKYK